MATPDPDILGQLLGQKQFFFLPYYCNIVAKHPAGISAPDVKKLVAAELLDQHGIDIFDPTLTGHNPSTARSSADQWANNLTSNRVLDERMLVVRGRPVMLYPGTVDNSRPVASVGKPLTSSQVADLDRRRPSTLTNSSQGANESFRRSIQLAEYVRNLNSRVCAVASDSCATFQGRDGRLYIEAHHLIPMSLQRQTHVNLDRSTNMVPVCPSCHTCLHRGASAAASERLAKLLRWFELAHGKSFELVNRDVALDITHNGLLAIYASIAPPE